MTIHVPQSIGSGNFVLPSLNHSALEEDSFQGINTVDRRSNLLLLHPQAQLSQMTSKIVNSRIWFHMAKFPCSIV
jgi:hypothetical protein